MRGVKNKKIRRTKRKIKNYLRSTFFNILYFFKKASNEKRLELGALSSEPRVRTWGENNCQS